MVNENILYHRGGLSQGLTTGGNDGVLIIDPNRVINENGEVSDRYIKQEDLMLYCSLAVYKKDKTSIIYNENTNNKSVDAKNEALININFLNPIKNRNENGSYSYKNKFTTEWADFFTSKDINETTLDPETFGITNIDISINANFVPTVTIEFTDVQGRTLFERGNDPNNPYNIFFTYPYPKFILAVKGYYGATVEFPLLLSKTNTKFNPADGSYITTCVFLGDMFSLFNSFLLIYAYAAPYMYQKENGEYKGMEILTALYERQNAKIIADFNGDLVKASDYIIENAPTLNDLAQAITKLPISTKDGVSNDTIDLENKNKEILNIKYRIDQFLKYISTFINRKDNYNLDSDNFYTAITSENIISDTTPIELINRIKSVNDEINKLESDFINEFNIKLKTSLREYYEASKIKIDFNKFDRFFKNKQYLNIHLLIVEDNKYTLDYFNVFINNLLLIIDDKQNEIDDLFIENQITDFGKQLKWKPNLSNVLRIVSNNIQTFLHLLDATSLTAQSQIQSDPNRTFDLRDIDYIKLKNGINKIKPFPNYYKKNIDAATNNERLELGYPGSKESNTNWVEVKFIDEIYNAVERLRIINGISFKNEFNSQETGLLSVFSFGTTDLSILNKNTKSIDYVNILSELIVTNNLFITHSGLPLHGLNTYTLNTVGQTLSDYNIGLLNSLIFSDLDSNSKFILFSDILNVLEPDQNNDHLNGLAKNLTVNNFTTNDNGPSIFEIKMIPEIAKEINLIKKNGTQKEYNDILNNKTNIINDSLVGDKTLYNTINYTNSPLQFTQATKSLVKSGKNTVNFDIGLNRNYNTINYDILDQINKLDVESINENTNSLQGYVNKLNLLFSENGYNTNLGNSILFKTDVNGSPQYAPGLVFTNNFAEDFTLQEQTKTYSYIFKEYI